jgi:ABC-type transport system involved in Fe-S cluster assembly, permease component
MNIQITQSPLSDAEKTTLSKVGYVAESERAATVVIADQEVRHISINDDQVEILPIAEALKKYVWVQELYFGLIDVNEAEEVQHLARSADAPVGHFIRVKAGAKLEQPIQSFCLLETPQVRQVLHNITVIEEGAQASVISGSSVADGVHTGQHTCLCETYLRESARCESLSIEQWAKDVDVMSYDRADVAKSAHCSSNKVMVSPVRNHCSRTSTTVGEDATAKDQSIVFAPQGTTRMMEGEIHLRGERAHAESLTRMVTAGGTIGNNAMLVGEADDTEGFLGCDGLKLTSDGEILSVPALRALSEKSQLSHEASVGMVSEEKLAYLESLGLTEDSANELIVQGFLNLKEQEMPAPVRETVKDMISAAKSGSM